MSKLVAPVFEHTVMVEALPKLVQHRNASLASTISSPVGPYS